MLTSILKEISRDYSLEGPMLKLKLQYSGPLMRRADSLEKTLMLGKTEGGRRRGWKLTPVFLPGEFHGQRSLAGYSPWGCKESDKMEGLTPMVIRIRQDIS